MFELVSNIYTKVQAGRTLDVGLCMDIMRSMWDDISEDGAEEYYPDVVGEYWVQMFTDETIGLYRLHRLNAITYQIHAFILPKHRENHANESGKMILQWCRDNLEFNKLVAEIPFKYENVYRFTLAQGFRDEGVNRESFLKNGKIWDQWRLGLLRSEI